MRCSECNGYIRPPRRGPIGETCSPKCRVRRSRRLNPKTVKDVTHKVKVDDERRPETAENP